MQRILFLTTPEEDYLSDSVLFGLKELDDTEVVDYPKRESLYISFPRDRLNTIYGNGFSLYGCLDDHDIDRDSVMKQLTDGRFDAVIVGNLWIQWEFVRENLAVLRRHRTVLLDGADNPRVFPHSGSLMKNPMNWPLSRLRRSFVVHKRELSVASARLGVLDRIAPSWLKRFLDRTGVPSGIKPISFSIPSRKVVSSPPTKLKLFPNHIVDRDVVDHLGDRSDKYLFSQEREYYNDLQVSKFGITTKRSGWDCMRHYEIAANGAVVCFRDLDLKPIHSAPHGLVPGENCVSYHSVDELMDITDQMSAEEYRRLQANSLSWITENTCEYRANALLSSMQS